MGRMPILRLMLALGSLSLKVMLLFVFLFPWVWGMALVSTFGRIFGWVMLPYPLLSLGFFISRLCIILLSFSSVHLLFLRFPGIFTSLGICMTRKFRSYRLFCSCKTQFISPLLQIGGFSLLTLGFIFFQSQFSVYHFISQ